MEENKKLAKPLQEKDGDERSIVVFKSSNIFMRIEKITLTCEHVHLHAQEGIGKALTLIFGWLWGSVQARLRKSCELPDGILKTQPKIHIELPANTGRCTGSRCLRKSLADH